MKISIEEVKSMVACFRVYGSGMKIDDKYKKEMQKFLKKQISISDLHKNLNKLD